MELRTRCLTRYWARKPPWLRKTAPMVAHSNFLNQPSSSRRTWICRSKTNNKSSEYARKRVKCNRSKMMIWQSWKAAWLRAKLLYPSCHSIRKSRSAGRMWGTLSKTRIWTYPIGWAQRRSQFRLRSSRILSLTETTPHIAMIIMTLRNIFSPINANTVVDRRN